MGMVPLAPAQPNHRPVRTKAMNFLCQHCQQMLTVPEQYPGQLMKCPLCGATFTVPSLPQSPASPASQPPTVAPDTYGVAHEAPLAASPAPPPLPPPARSPEPEPPEPAEPEEITALPPPPPR